MKQRKVLLLAVLLLSAVFILFVFLPQLQHPNSAVRETENGNRLVPPQFSEKSFFLTPIKSSKTKPTTDRITGITVPHHLLARDLIADAFQFSAAQKPKQILLVSPDHFNLGKKNISVSENNFSTVFGAIKTDIASVKKLRELKVVGAGDFFYREHGLGAELPFIKYYFPDAEIIVVTVKESTPKNEVDILIESLKTILSNESFIVQSTDFSHYLSPKEANERDQQTIKFLTEGLSEDIFKLHQPKNLDSIASQYVQARLQKEFFGSKIQILAHKNSQEYTNEIVESSTSYIVQAYEKSSK